MRTSVLLQRARNRITLAYRWTQWARARNIHKVPVEPKDPTAESWSMDGALERECEYIEDLTACSQALRPFTKTLTLFFNDSKKHQDCLRAFDLAIAAERQRERLERGTAA